MLERFVHAALFALIAVAAWTYSRAVPAHRTLALLFGWDLLANVARLAIDPMLDAASVPYTGGALALYYLDHALVLSFRFALLAACLARFERTSILPAAYGFAFVVVGVIIAKETTGVSLVPIHHGISALTIIACWILALRAVFAPATRIQTPDGAHAVLLLLLAADLVKVSLHYFRAPGETWFEVRWADLLVHGLIAIGYLGALARQGVVRWRA